MWKVLVIALAAAGSEPVQTTRLGTVPVIDGNLADPVWQAVPALRELTQQLPAEGAPPTERTEIRLGYDDRAIYFAVRLWDSQPDQIVARLTRRDRDVASDAVLIDIDPQGDHQSAFHFEVSAANVQRDAIRTGDVADAVSFDWDAVWRSAVMRDATGWTAEIAIPLSTLRFAGARPGQWRLQVRRFIARRNETDALVLIPHDDFGEMQRYAPVLGVADLSPPSGLQVRPFGLARLRARPAYVALDAPTQTDLRWQVGVDARDKVTSGLTLDATVLPDFGQVEADQVILNLSTFELKFPEKRPFFLEGADLLTLRTAHGPPVGSAQLFYSRRIGAAAPRASASSGYSVVDAPEQVHLLGAAKLLGKATDQVSLAVVDAVTAPESAVLQTPDGSTLVQPLAPVTNVLAARSLVLLEKQWLVGTMATHVLRFEKAGSLLSPDGKCPGGSAPGVDLRCTHDAAAALVDLRWESEDGSLISTPAFMLSYTPGGPARTLLDGTVIQPGDLGFGGRMVLVKGAGTWPWELIAETFSPTLDLNDAGFLPSQNFTRASGKLSWRTFKAGPFRDTQLSLTLLGRQSWDGVPLERSATLLQEVTWKNAWKSTLQVQGFSAVYDNRETRDGARTERAPELALRGTVTTDPAVPLSGSASAAARTTWRGYNFGTTVGLAYRPAGQLELLLEGKLTRVLGDPRWVETVRQADGSARFRFGLQDVTSPGLTFRGTMTFNPEMTLQAYAQLFFASVRYGDLFEVGAAELRPRLRLGDFEPVAADPSKYESRDAVLNVNVIFRYEYLPGSVLYLVFTRSHSGGQVPLDPLDSERVDFSALGRAPVENAFLLKVSYYFNG
jgi:hypothetical protein